MLAMALNRSFYSYLLAFLLAITSLSVSAEGLRLLANISGADDFTELDDLVYFSAQTSEQPEGEVVVTDGNSIWFIRKFVTSATPRNPSQLTVFNGELYFAAEDAAGDRELWKTNGTTLGTIRVKNINPGIDGSNPFNLIVAGNLLYFTAEFYC